MDHAAHTHGDARAGKQCGARTSFASVDELAAFGPQLRPKASSRCPTDDVDTAAARSELDRHRLNETHARGSLTDGHNARER